MRKYRITFVYRYGDETGDGDIPVEAESESEACAAFMEDQSGVTILDVEEVPD